MTDLRQRAHGYADRDWSIFPCQPRGKRPITQHGLKDATADHDVIDKWWKAEPEANIGIPTGIAFDVLDVDGDEGHASLGIEMPWDAPTIDGPTVATGKPGGAHVYVTPTGLGNRASFIPGCDWRGAGGYVIGAGSVHPNGEVYRWKCGEDDPNFGIDAPILPVRQWLLDLLAPKPTPPTSGIVRPCSAGSYGQAALRSECERVALAPEGMRNHTLNVAAFSLAQLVAGGLLDPDETAGALLEAAAKSGLGTTEARRTIASGFKAGLAQPRRVAS